MTTRNIPMNHSELAIVLAVFEGQPTEGLTDAQFSDRRAVHAKFIMAFDGIVLVEEILESLPEDFRHKVYDTYHDPNKTPWRGRIPAIKMVYERLGKRSLREAKEVAEAIGGEISSWPPSKWTV